MRLKCKLAEPGALQGMHSGISCAIQFAGTAVSYIKAFFGFYIKLFYH